MARFRACWLMLQLYGRCRLDGQPPVISGKIRQEYLKKAAVEIFDVAPGEVNRRAAELHDRLKLYAALFQLELPAVGDDVERQDDRPSRR
jgi:hypothetical protein